MRRRRILSVAVLALFGMILTSARADELTGHVKSIGADHNSLVVTETGTDKDFTIEVSGRTVIETPDGRTLLVKDLRRGDGVGITHKGGAASKILVSVKPPTAPGTKLTGHVKSLGANQKSLVVTETGTNKDYTIEVSGRTVIETADGRALLIKDLRRGDGVGINHEGGTASKITVSPKP